tara:strand:+ start:508 stop:798 length:291 start_codon:yes stop_codon:yes gene_type:complete
MSSLNTNVNPQNHMNMNIKMEDTTEICCDNCGGVTFEMVLYFRRVSALVSPTAQEAVVPLNLYACKRCQHINKEFLPKGVEITKDKMHDVKEVDKK